MNKLIFILLIGFHSFVNSSNFTTMQIRPEFNKQVTIDLFKAVDLCLPNVEEVKRALANGADFEAKDTFGHTPLHIASSKKSIEAVYALIDAGANVNTKNNVGQTPLHAAVAANFADVGQILVDAGANLEAKTNTGATPLDVANINRAYSAAQMLTLNSKIKNLNEQDSAGNTALHRAVKFDSLAAVERLLQVGVDCNIRNRDGETPLDVAINNQRDQIAQLLVLENDFLDVEEKDRSGRSLLHVAVLNNMPKLVKALVARKANVNVRHIAGNTPLHYAVRESIQGMVHPEILQTLIVLGRAHINTKNDLGYTPLDVAFANFLDDRLDQNAVMDLIEFGAESSKNLSTDEKNKLAGLIRDMKHDRPHVNINFETII